ncbi:MAG: hypothetical protein ACR2FO_00225 [Actinomycetota bacterium]
MIRALAINTLKSFDPPVEAILGTRITGLRRRGKHIVIGSTKLHKTMLSPFKGGNDLTEDEAGRLWTATVKTLGSAFEFYEASVSLPIPDKFPMPLTVHRRIGLPCPRCGDEIKAVYFEDGDLCYCPACQTGGKLLKDRRMSRLLK